jgi:hypothetical protein
MIATEKKNTVILTVTGLTGSGKSTVGTALELNSYPGVEVHFVDDYPAVKQFAEEHRHDPRMVTWQKDKKTNGEFFILKPRAYPIMTPQKTRATAQALKNMISPDINQMLVMEVACGAGNTNPDRYDRDVWNILIEQLGLVAVLANIQYHVPVPELIQRVDDRYKIDPTAAPPEVVHKYLNSHGYQQSASRQAKQYPPEVMIFNAQIENIDREKTLLQTHLAVSRILQITGMLS